MSEQCRLCGQDVPDGVLKLDMTLGRAKPWHAWSQGSYMDVPGVGFVQCIAVHVERGERHFGGDVEAAIILMTGGKVYKKIGTTSSYGSTKWDGHLIEVVLNEEVRKGWERA